MKFVVIDNGDKYSISANSLIDAKVAVFKKLLEKEPDFWKDFAYQADIDVIDPDELESYV
jgi:hypothetical protein